MRVGNEPDGWGVWFLESGRMDRVAQGKDKG